MLRKIITTLTTMILFVLLVATTTAQETPSQLDSVLSDLSQEVGTTVTENDLTSYSWQTVQFGDSSLGCPEEGEVYQQVITPGIQFDIVYDGIVYDYRASQAGDFVTLCSTLPMDGVGPTLPMKQAMLTINPLTGNVGDTIQITANGFPANTIVVVGIGEVASEYEIVQTTRTNRFGAVQTGVVIPNYLDTITPDELVVVMEVEDGSVRAISYPFQLLPSDQQASDPAVTITPRVGDPGTEVTANGSGFPANANVILGVGPQNGEFAYSLRVTTDAQGMFQTPVSIPEDARVNRDWIVLAEVEEDRDNQAISPTFTVSGIEPTPVPDGATFTTSDIYLIAIGVESTNTIGCGDSVIPVEVSYEPTVAPLTASLNALFSIDTRTYGQSGLYNALYQSDIRVEDIDISNAGNATIRLSGDLQIGGACDAPRIIQQIEQTALQFSTVESVDIFLDGQPLEDVFSA